jgi:thiosulfate reductase cytochrome b subunit
MNPSQHAEQFQSQLANYVPQFTPEFWPVWLIIAGVLLVGMWLVLGLHALLRARGVKKSATDHGEKIYLYSKAVRLWHWSNALLFVLLLASGLINHFAMVGATAVKSLVAVHEVCGFLLLACWLGFVLINAVGDNGHHYRIRRQGWLERAAKQTRFYLFGIMQGEEHPFPATTQSKFNPLQQVAYVGVCMATLTAIFTVSLREQIALLYNDNPEVVTLAAHLMLLAAVYQISDSIQVIGSGILRGYKDTRSIFYITFTAYWVLGLPSGYILALTDLVVEPMGPAGFWIGFIIGLTSAAIMMMLRMRFLQRLPSAIILQRASR